MSKINANGIVISSEPLATRVELIARSVEKGKNARCADTAYFTGLSTLTKQYHATEEKISLWEPLVNVFPEIKAKYDALKQELETMKNRRKELEEKHDSLGFWGRLRKEKILKEIGELVPKIKTSQAEYDVLDSRIRGFQTADELKAALAGCKNAISVLEPKIEELTEAREKYLRSSIGEYCYEAAVEELKDPETKAEFIKKYPALSLKVLEVGDRFFFGRCMQPSLLQIKLPNAEWNGIRDSFYYTDPSKKIEWRVLAKKEDKILVISEYLIACMQYGYPYNHNIEPGWHKSRIRKWLNEKFYENYFTEEQRKFILKTKTGRIQKSENLPKEDIIDSIFLLSMNEIEQYFKNEEDRIQTYYTPETTLKNSFNWATRDSFLGGANHNVRRIVYINSKGEQDGEYSWATSDYGVRPAMWLKC